MVFLKKKEILQKNKQKLYMHHKKADKKNKSKAVHNQQNQKDLKDYPYTFCPFDTFFNLYEINTKNVRKFGLSYENKNSYNVMIQKF